MIAGALVFIALPLLVWLGQARAPADGWRAAAMRAAVAWAAAGLILTECLSVGHALRFGPVLAAWVVIDGALAIFVWREWRRGVRPTWPRLGDWSERLVAAALAVLLGLSLVTAMGAPPNTPDALSYHLPRQLMWLQQGGVQHFVSHDDRALMMPPLAEMLQAQALLLAGGDAWANFPQWLAYALGCAVASLLARELGGNRRAQSLAALVFATLPMAYLEASSAKNDLLVAIWLGIFAWQALRLARAERRPLTDWVLAATALGLALATKTTAFLFAAAIGLWLLPVLVREWRRALLFPALALLLAGPHWSRNFAWYGTPLGIHRAEDGGAQGSELYSWRGTVSNAARNATLYLGSPSEALNRRLAGAVARVHRWIGQDLNDPRTTLWVLKYEVNWQPRSEPTAGAPAQFVLGGGVIAWVLLRGRRRPETWRLLAMAAGGALLCCVLLKWQPWGARLHLPIFVLLAPLIAVAAEEMGAWAAGFAGLVCVAGWLPSAESDARPWWTPPTIFSTSRWSNYFRTHPFDQGSTEAFARTAAAAGVGSVEIVTKHGFPYPLMQRFLAVGAPRASLWGALPAAATTPPDGVVLLEPFERSLPLYLQVPGATARYRAIGATDPIGLYVPEPRARALATTLPLPNFVGWDVAENLGSLEFEAAGHGVQGVRRLLASQVRLRFHREAARMRVQIEASNPSAAACALELQLDGVRVARVSFEPDASVQMVEVPLAPAGERAELVLSFAGSAAPPLRLIALRILD